MRKALDGPLRASLSGGFEGLVPDATRVIAPVQRPEHLSEMRADLGVGPGRWRFELQQRFALRWP